MMFAFKKVPFEDKRYEIETFGEHRDSRLLRDF